MKISFFHARILFYLKLQLKRKKVGLYLLSIRAFVYLCVEIESVT